MGVLPEVDEQKIEDDLRIELSEDQSIIDNLLSYASRKQLDELYYDLKHERPRSLLSNLRCIWRIAIRQEVERQLIDRIKNAQEEELVRRQRN